MSFKNLILTLCCAALSLFLVSCQIEIESDSSDKSKSVVYQSGAEETSAHHLNSSDSIVFGVKADSPPFGVANSDGDYWGFDIDIAKAICEELGKTPKFVRVKSSDRIHYILSGKVDLVIASMTITRSREQQVDFSIPYFQDGQGLLGLKGSNVNSYRDLSGKKVGAVSGSTSYKNMVKVQPNCQMVAFNGYDQALESLLAGKIDALTSDYLILTGLLNRSKQKAKLELKGDRFTIEPYGIALAENNSNLRDTINGTLMLLWEKGTWQDIFSTWFGEGTDYQTEIDFQIPVTP